jgi:hypothetical protein
VKINKETRGDMKDLRADMNDLRADMNNLRVDLHADMKAFRTDLPSMRDRQESDYRNLPLLGGGTAAGVWASLAAMMAKGFHWF